MRTLILGLDAFDPNMFERLYEQGKMTHLASYVQNGLYKRFEVSNPAQSEVSWTSIASGLNPGQHGLFDFVHRDPKTYSLYVSLLPTRAGLGGTHFVRPHRARTVFDIASDKGYAATTLWWPATFPAQPGSPVRTLPGLGTPDIQGRLGVGTLFTSDVDFLSGDLKTGVEALKRSIKDEYVFKLYGPVRKSWRGEMASWVPFSLKVTSSQTAELEFGHQRVELRTGEWSPILELDFKMGLLASLKAITRVILTSTQPEVSLYFLPLQIHPLKSPWRYASPGSFVRGAWKGFGPFLTLGWPQDTQALEDGVITDEQFLELCDSIFQRRVEALLHTLKDFNEGIVGAVFDTLDRVQHMFWKRRPDIVEAWYIKLDALVGEVEKAFSMNASPDDRLIIVSDHGFTHFDHKVHLNRWLMEGGFLASRNRNGEGAWKDIDWPNSAAYAVGLNSLYLNMRGREGEGMVQPDQTERVIADLETRLLNWEGPDWNPVVQGVWRNQSAFKGSQAARGPDLVVGYAPGFRASAETGMGGWRAEAVAPNGDHWSADHCIDPTSVPGVIFANRDLEHYSNPSYRDIPALAIGEGPSDGGAPPPVEISPEEEETLQERLKSLGYF